MRMTRGSAQLQSLTRPFQGWKILNIPPHLVFPGATNVHDNPFNPEHARIAFLADKVVPCLIALVAGIVIGLIASALDRELSDLLGSRWYFSWTSWYQQNSSTVNLSSCNYLKGTLAQDECKKDVLLEVAEDFLENANECSTKGGEFIKKVDGSTYECWVFEEVRNRWQGPIIVSSELLFEWDTSGWL